MDGGMKMENDDGGAKVTSSVGQFMDFIESTVWADMKRELDVWLEGVRDISEDPKTEAGDRLISIGRIDALKYFKTLPEVMKDSLIRDQEISSPESEDETQEREELLND